jgi:protein phosphatase
VIVCRDEEAARKHFGVIGEGIGICYTRTGRRFFNDQNLESEFLARIRTALDATQFWQELNTHWACFDCELMPWSAKAQELLKRQYASTGASARAALNDAVQGLTMAATQNAEVAPLLEHYRQRMTMAHDYVEAYRRYCWPINSITDLKLAPFHLLATEGALHTDKDHLWHMRVIARVCEADPELLMATPHLVVDVTDPDSQKQGIGWWEGLTASGGEGMVVKPLEFIAKGDRGLLQPAVKCRGREYLRIIYGPEYSAPENLERLRARALGGKRSLALREFALGIESLRRFVALEPLRKVHECVFAVLALESVPVDPRL